MKTLLALWFAACIASVAAEDAWKPLGYVKEGVYSIRVPNTTNIIELKDGHFRRWTAYPMGSGDRLSYSRSFRTGDYTTNGGTIRFVTEGRPSSITNEFTFIEFNGKVTLWNSYAVKSWEKNKWASPIGILEPTDGTPEEILEGKEKGK